MANYKAQYIREGEVVDEVASPDPREVEDFVRRIATHIVIVDDARHNGTGDFIAGEINWGQVD